MRTIAEHQFIFVGGLVYVLGTLGCATSESPGSYLAGMPSVYGTRLGHPWAGPNTCIAGARAAEAQRSEGWDPSQLWYDVEGFTDSATLREVWAASEVCVTDMPPLPEDSAAFVAVLTDGIVTKMIYAFDGPDLVNVATGLLNTVSHNLDERWAESETPPEWERDTLRVSLRSQGRNLFGVPLVQLRSRRGCDWLKARFANSPDAVIAATCW